MPNLNAVSLMGNITRDPELKFMPNGNAVCDFSIAINEQWNDDAGNKKEKTTFIDITAFGKTAEVISKHHQKGDAIYIAGKLDQQTWEDKQTGAHRSKIRIVANSFEFLKTRRDDEGGERQKPSDSYRRSERPRLFSHLSPVNQSAPAGRGRPTDPDLDPDDSEEIPM